MDRTQHIYLVPGFLGFAHLGRITYFGHVRRVLTERLTALGLEPCIHIVRTSPTASLPDRAARVAEVMHATAPRGGAPLHLIGHSSGGLDVRLLTAPGVGLPTALDVERLAGPRADGRHGFDASPRDTARVVLHDAARPAADAAALAQHHLRAQLWPPAARRTALDGEPLRAIRRSGRRQRAPRRALRKAPRGLHAATPPGGTEAVARRGPRPGADAPADARGDGGLQCLGPAASRHPLRRGRRAGGAARAFARRSTQGSIRRRR